MRGIFIILLTALLFSGCSPKHTAHVDQTVDIVAGKDLVFPGYVLSVKKRDGTSLEGIRVVQSGPDGTETLITADTGTVTQSPKQSVEPKPADARTKDKLRVIAVRNSVKLKLFNASVQTKTPTGTSRMTVEQWELDF